MFFEKLFKLLSAKDIAASSFIFLPVSDILIRIVPQEVCNKSSIRHICRFSDVFDLVKASHIFGEPSVHAHDFLINQSHKRHVIKTVIKLLPQPNFVPSLDFVKKSINPCDCLTFVVTS